MDQQQSSKKLEIDVAVMGNDIENLGNLLTKLEKNHCSLEELYNSMTQLITAHEHRLNECDKRTEVTFKKIEDLNTKIMTHFSDESTKNSSMESSFNKNNESFRQGMEDAFTKFKDTIVERVGQIENKMYYIFGALAVIVFVLKVIFKVG